MGGTIGYVWPIIALSTAGLLAGFAAGLFGIGDGFVVVPALIVTLPLLGGDASELAHVAIATSLATIIITLLRSVFAHARRGAVDFETIKVWSPWIVMGVGVGIMIAARIPGTVLALIWGRSHHYGDALPVSFPIRKNGWRPNAEGWITGCDRGIGRGFFRNVRDRWWDNCHHRYHLMRTHYSQRHRDGGGLWLRYRYPGYGQFHDHYFLTIFFATFYQ